MESSQNTLSSKSTEEIDSLQKTKIELEERVASIEMKLQEKSEVSKFLDDAVTYHLCRSVLLWKRNFKISVLWRKHFLVFQQS